MRLSQHRRSALKKVRSALIDVLESRLLFAGETLATPIASVLANVADPSANSITLSSNFTNGNIPGTLATFDTNFGTIKVGLTDTATPLTVANFLHYINTGEYNDTIFHRSAILNGSNSVVTKSNPADIIQGGGYVVQNNAFVHVPTVTPVNDEFRSELFGDVAGTLAMAKTSQADSATSEWYFNVHDDTSALDSPTTDSNGVTTSYTVFGKVYTGMNVIDEIAALPTYNVSAAIGSLPVVGLTPGEANKSYPISVNNLVYVLGITTTAGTTYSATSSDSSLVTPIVNNGVLSFDYASGKFGTADITVTAKNLDGTSATGTFAVTLPNSATPAAGPSAAALTAPNVSTGTTATISVLGSATDSVAALNASSVAIITQPAHGTATVDTTNGTIRYTPTAGYTGTDSLTYDVSDNQNSVSSPATITLNVVPAPETITLGSSTARSLTFTQPNGGVGHLTVGNGAAVVTFASSDVTITRAGGVATATGSGATIASIIITNRGSAATLSLKSTGPVTLGSIMDTGRLAFIDAVDATLAGDITVAGISRINAAAVTGADLSLGSANGLVLQIPTVTDSSLIDTGSIASIRSTQWLATDGGYYAVLAPGIDQLKVSGAFAEALTLSGTGISLQRAKTGIANAAWTAAGSIGSVLVASPASTWSLAAIGSVGTLTIAGNLGASNVSAGSIGTFAVTGTTIGAMVTTSDGFSTKKLGISKLKFGGAITGSTIIDVGSAGTVTAPSMDTDTISAATITSINVPGTVNAVTFKTTSTVATKKPQISQLRIGGAFTNSSLTANGSVGSITAPSLASTNLSASSITSLQIAGATSSASITTSSTTVADKMLRFIGPVIGSSIAASSTITRLSAPSWNTSSLTAASIDSLRISGTATAATITTTSIKLKDQSLQFGGAIINSSITASSTVTDLTTPTWNTSSLTVASIGALHVNGITTAATITTNSSNLKDGTLQFRGAITGSNISATGAVGTIRAASMATNNLTAEGIDTFTVTGTTTDTTINTTVSTSKIGRVRFGGAVNTTKIAAAGAIGSVTAPSLTGSQIFAGIASAVSAVPTLATNSSSVATAVEIGSVILGRTAVTFSNSLISADTIGDLRLGNVASANTTTFGVSAHQIDTLTATLVPGGSIHAGAAQLKSEATLAAYESARQITLGEFTIDLF